MSTSITIHDLPDDVVAALEARATVAGLSLSEYLRAKLVDLTRRPKTTADWVAEEREAKRTDGAEFSREEIARFRELDRR
jgi:antitoxin FitA